MSTEDLDISFSSKHIPQAKDIIHEVEEDKESDIPVQQFRSVSNPPTKKRNLFSAKKSSAGMMSELDDKSSFSGLVHSASDSKSAAGRRSFLPQNRQAKIKKTLAEKVEQDMALKKSKRISIGDVNQARASIECNDVVS